MVKAKIACYITGGWTECGYMTRFLEKINNQYTYLQRFPQKNIGKKNKSRADLKIDGKTGTNLIRWIYDDMRVHKKDFSKYSAILIEDDLDDQFFLESKEKRDYEQIEERKREITKNIQKILENERMPVFFLYALPEIEAWFLSDWDNTFGIEYKRLLSDMNLYFSTTFRKFITRKILTDKFSGSEIENFGYIDSQYEKLSDKLIWAYSEYSYMEADYKNNMEYNEKINNLIRNNEIMYSKKKEGINMLQRLEPDKVASGCPYYFAKAYMELKFFNVDNMQR